MLIYRRQRKSQPPAGVGINRNNPFARGLILALSGAEPSRNLAGRGAVALELNNPIPGSAGADGYSADSSGGVFLYYTPDTTLTDATLLSIERRTNSQQGIWNTNSSEFDFAPYSDDNFYFNTFASARYISAVAPPAGWRPERYVVVARGGAAASSHAAFVNGTKIGSTNSSFVCDSQIRLGSNRSTFGSSYLRLMWDRVLTDAEVSVISANPWQVLTPPARRLWVGVSAGGPASHDATGTLTASAATLAGTAAHATLHASTGVLAASAATLAGTAAHATLHASTASLAADAATLAGTAARTGAAGTHAASGALQAAAATLAGTAAHATLHSSSGVLAASAATLAGAAALVPLPRTHAATGSLVASAAVLSAEAMLTPIRGAGGGYDDKPKKRRFVTMVDGKVQVWSNAQQAVNALDKAVETETETLITAAPKAKPAKVEEQITVQEIRQVARNFDQEAKVLDMFRQAKYAETLALYRALRLRQEMDDEEALLMLL